MVALVDQDRLDLSAEALAVRCQEGCLASFEELVYRFEGRILNFLRKMVVNFHDAQDLTQETFVKAYKNIRRFDPKYSFSTWLYTIAKRTALNHYRSHRATVEWTADKEINLEDPAKLLEQKDASESIWAKAQRILGSSQFEALRLRYGEGFSIAQTAAVMETNELRVRVLLHRARSMLAKHLGSYGREF